MPASPAPVTSRMSDCRPAGPTVILDGEVHVWAPTPGLKSSIGKIGRGLDVKAEGGYVLLPPFLRRDEHPA